MYKEFLCWHGNNGLKHVAKEIALFDSNNSVMVNLALPKPGRLVLLKDNFILILITDITRVTRDMISLIVIV